MTGTPGRRSLHVRSASEKVEDERGRAPANGGSSSNSDRLDTANPLEARVAQIEGNLESLRTGMNQILDALNKPTVGIEAASNGAPAQVPQAPPQWSTPSQPQQQNGIGQIAQLTPVIDMLSKLDGPAASSGGLAEQMLMISFKGYQDLQSILARVALEKLTMPAGAPPHA